MLGSPPLARERPATDFSERRRRGITPACAGKTHNRARGSHDLEDHPRLRGKDSSMIAKSGVSAGITPACAGKTNFRLKYLNDYRDHPRLRGKDSM